MKTPKTMRPALRRRLRRGYTLLELSLAIGIGLMVAGLSLAMLNQQVAFLKIFRAQDFLATEAPLINYQIGRIVSHADGFRLHSSLENAEDRTNPVLDDATVLVLRFKQPGGGFRESVLAFYDPGTGSGIYYHFINDDGTIGDPQWAVSKEVDDTKFSIENGILRVRLTGPNGEEITYSGAQQL